MTNIINKAISIFFRDEAYGIAIRKKGKSVFHPIQPNGRRSYADPFVFEYNGKTAVFVELMDYHYGWGTIGCFEIEKDRILPVKEIIREDNHMSFPNVFEHDGTLFIMPETYGANDVHLYKCISFPYVWEKQETLLENIHLVDHAIFEDGGKTYVISFDLDQEKSRCFLLDWEKHRLTEFFPEGDFCTERPGGSFIRKKEKVFRVIQDCKQTYGDFLRFYKVDAINEKKFDEHQIREMRIEDFRIAGNDKFSHTHQYSESLHYSVIDYHYQRFYWNKIIRFLVRILFHPHRHFE